jgi:hypothetical protein
MLKFQKIIIEVIKMYDIEMVYHKKIRIKKKIIPQKKMRIMKMLIQKIMFLKKKLRLKEHEKI